MQAVMMEKFYVTSGQLRVVILGEAPLDAAVRAFRNYADNKMVGTTVAVHKTGFNSVRGGSHSFQTDYVMELLT